MVHINIDGKKYFLNFNMLGMMELEEAFGGDLSGMYNALKTEKNQIRNIIRIMHILINTTAEELERDDLRIESERWLALHLDADTIRQANQTILMALAAGTKTISNDDEVRDIFLEEDRREEAEKNP